ncbi:MAG: CRISPR-associated protein Csx3 [Trichlorobacter sp.]|nr:CRISPR-associated protein Csx3 [Trichlorobacter sp.]
MASQITIDIETLYEATGAAKLAMLPEYEQKAKELAGTGNEITLTGQGPVWLYLRLAHTLHGKAVKLSYNSPVTGSLLIFDHSPY